MRSGTNGVATTCWTVAGPAGKFGRIASQLNPAWLVRPPHGLDCAAWTDTPTPLATVVPSTAVASSSRTCRIRCGPSADGRRAAAAGAGGLAVALGGRDPLRPHGATGGWRHLLLQRVELGLQRNAFERLVLGEYAGELVEPVAVVLEQDLGGGQPLLQEPA